MLRDRYDPMNLFDHIPALGMETDAVLTQLDTLLDDDELFQAIKADLSRRFPRTSSFGRPSTPVEVLLRMLVIKHLYHWSYEQAEQWVSDSLVLRQFCRVSTARVPDDTTLLRWANQIQPATLQRLLDHVVVLARQHHVTRGRKLRLDSTVVETTVHYPVDSTLLADGVRVLARTIRRAKPSVAGTVERARTLLRDRTRRVRRVTKELIEAARRRGEQGTQDVQTCYERLLDLTQQVVTQAQQVQQHLQTHVQPGADRLAQRLTQTLQAFIPRVEQVIRQTMRRVIHGESVPAKEKLVSLFEPHTASMRTGKAGKPVEFGRVLWLGEAEGGIITQAQILAGNPDDAAQFVPAWSPTASSSAAHRICWPATASWRRQPMSRPRSNVALNESCSHGRDAKPPHARPTSDNAGFAAAETGAQGSKGASAGSNAGPVCAGVATTVMPG